MKKLFALLTFTFQLLNLLCFAQQNKIDSLLTLLKTDKVDSIKFIHLINVSDEYRIIGLYDKALQHANTAISLAKQLNFKTSIANSFNNIGNVYSDQGDYPIALDYYLQALKIEEELKDKKQIARHLCNIGSVYYVQSDYPKALDYYLKSLKIGEELKDKKLQSVNLCNIGNVYYSQNDYNKTLNYYQRALKIDEELGIKNEIASDFGNIGSVYADQSNYPKALEYNFKALKMAEEFGAKNLINSTLGNIGNIYSSQRDYNKALDYYQKALKIAEELGDKNRIAIWLGNIGSLYTKQNKYNNASNYLYRSLILSDSIGSMSYVKDWYEQLSILYEKSNIPLPDSIGGKLLNIEQMRLRSLYYYKRSIAIRDTLFSEDNKKQLVRKEMNFEFEKKEAVMKSEQEKERAIAEEKSRKQKIVILFVVVGLLLVIIFSGFIYRSLRITRKQKNIIEEQKILVDEKNNILNQQNEEIRAQRDEIDAQKDEITAQRDLVTEQKDHIEEIHKKVTDSINYAKRIQEAILPISDATREVLGEHFVLFKPKDIVSGDFYWTTKINEFLIVTVADCTGHGVPGAFMSMLGISFLNEIVRKQEVKKANQVLNELRNEIINALQQKGIVGEQKDGMDISLLVINTATNECQWAGANNPLYIFARKQSTVGSMFSANCQLQTGDCGLFELKGNKMPIAIYPEMKDFTNHEFVLSKGDSVYLFTDGYADQFGGIHGRKFMYKKFKEILIANSQKPMFEQKIMLETTFENWRGKAEQIDDVTVLGIKI